MAVERVTFQGSMLAGMVENVVHFNNPDGLQTAAQIGAYLQVHWIEPLLTIHSTQFTWVQMLIQRVGQNPGLATAIPISPGQGSQAGDAAPPFVAALIKLQTAFPGRKGRGRIYLPGHTIGNFSQMGRLSVGSYQAWQSLVLTGWRNKFLLGGSAPITLVVAPRNDPDSFHFVEQLDVRLWASVQRRRNYFVGV